MTDPNMPGPSRPRHPSTRRFLSPSEPTVMESLEKTYSVKRSLNMFNDSWLYNRELGMRQKIGTENEMQKSLYSALKPIAKWGDMEQTGGIFNLEFSQDGSLLVAACEKKCVYMFDPLSKAVIGSIPEAHTDCVNYVRFLDTRVFATCSDDTTIALWDARNLKTRVRTLQGHSNWVKNIEFSWKDNLLVTAGFDGSIYTWDINNYTETGFVYDRVFQTNGLMRMRLNPDASKMVICTTAGYLILIHDLNLATLAQDLLGFRPNMYRLMQLSDTALPMAFEYHHLFSKGRTRNRVEFITDFPFGDEAEVISSLQIHPHGWCALSRNISNSERSEWTCVHDIQEYGEYTNEDNSSEEEEDNSSECLDSDPLAGPISGASNTTDTTSGDATTSSSSSSQRPIRRARRRQHPYNERTLLSNTTENRYPQLEISTADIWEALLVLREARSIQGGSGAAARSVLHQQEYDQDLVRIIRMSSGLPNQSQGGDESVPTQGDSDNDETESGDTTSDPDHEIDESANRSERLRQQRESLRRRRGSRRQGGGERGEGEETTTEGSGGGTAAGDSESNRVVFRFTNSRSEEQVFVVTDRSGNAATPGGANSNQRRTNSSGNRSGPKDQKANKKSAAEKKWFVQNKPRLTHYVEELNVGKGYIKELCFSSDGRLVCSPFSFGVRLFSFNEECAHMSSCMPHDGSHQVPAQLFELTSSSNHSDIVLSCKFSPTHNILASGCLNGRIVLYQPVF